MIWEVKIGFIVIELIKIKQRYQTIDWPSKINEIDYKCLFPFFMQSVLDNSAPNLTPGKKILQASHINSHNPYNNHHMPELMTMAPVIIFPSRGKPIRDTSRINKQLLSHIKRATDSIANQA